MQKSKTWMDYKADSGSCQCFMLSVDERQDGFKLIFDSKLDGNWQDMRFVFCVHESSQKLIHWVKNRTRKGTTSLSARVRDTSDLRMIQEGRVN